MDGHASTIQPILKIREVEEGLELLLKAKDFQLAQANISLPKRMKAFLSNYIFPQSQKTLQ